MSRPVEIWCRFPRLFIARKPTLMEVSVKNSGDFSLTSVSIEVRFQGQGFRKLGWEAGSMHVDGVEPRATILPTTPPAEGVFPVEILAVAHSADGRVFYGSGHVKPWGQAGLPVLTGRNLESVIINIERKAFFGSMLEHIDLPKITTLNDLLNTELKCEWDQVPLSWQREAPARLEEPAVDIHGCLKNWPAVMGEIAPMPGAEVKFLKTPVYQRLWRQVMGGGFREFLVAQDKKLADRMASFFAEDMPVFGVDYNDAMEFCDQFSCACHAAGLLPDSWVARLPTVQEWEAACDPVAMPLAPYCFNLKLPGHRLRGEGPVSVTELRTKFKPNTRRLLGMLGNLNEWCLAEPDNPGLFAPTIGGSWHRDECPDRTPPTFTTALTRRSSRIGFRVVLAKELQE